MKNKAKQYDVFFVDDDAAVRSAVADDLNNLGYKVSCFASAPECLEQLPRKNCNLLITDVKMPGMDGMALLKRVKKVAPWISVLVVTGFGDVPMCARAFKLGAVDFVEKPLDREIFLDKVKTILQRSDFFDTPADQILTKTEKKVLKLILDGDGNKQIANKLQRALRSVERHRSSIMHKFGVDNVVDLVKKTALFNLDDLE